MLNENPPVLSYESVLVFSKDYEGEVARAFKEYKEELENLINFISIKKDELKDHLFFVFSKGPKLVAVYAIAPIAPGYESIRKEIEK